MQSPGPRPSGALVAIVSADHGRSDRRLAAVRVLSIALVVVLVAEAAGVTTRLILDLVEGGPETNSPTDLLSVGFGVWLYAILAFAFLANEGDALGSASRPASGPDDRDARLGTCAHLC